MNNVQKPTAEEQVVINAIREIFHVMSTSTPNEQEPRLLRVIRSMQNSMVGVKNGEN